MIISDKYKAFFYALLIYIPTLFFGNEKYYLALPIALLILEQKTILNSVKTFTKKELLIYAILPVLFIILATINKLMNGSKICSLIDYYASFYLFIILIFSAYFVKQVQIFNYLLYLICIEVVICLIEYIANVRTFFVEIPISNSIANKDILYDIHVYGLSINSSMIALKIFTGIFIIECVKLPSYLKITLRIILMIGLIVTFNRAVILSIFFFWLLLGIRDLYKNGFTFQFGKKIFSTFFIFFIVFKFFSNESFIYQFTRGESTENIAISTSTTSKKNRQKLNETCATSKIPTIKNIDSFKKEGVTIQNLKRIDSLQKDQEIIPNIKNLDTFQKMGKKITNGFLTTLFLSNLPNINTSGRTLIWLNYLDFIDHHLLFGNGSDKFLIKSVDPDTNEVDIIHAHNSYLEQFATHGLLLMLFFFVILYLMWKKKNWIFILSILFYSLFQYGIFWGYSYLDLIFMLFLISDKEFLADGNT